MAKGLMDKISVHNFLHPNKLRFQYKYLDLEISSNVKLKLVNQICSSFNYDISFDVIGKIRDTYKYHKKTLILESSKEKVIIYKKDLGVFSLENGKKITLSPFSDYDPLVLSNTILNLVYGFVLYQRGQNVLHTSAVELDGKAVLFVGPSGSGKSSLASLFSNHGRFITEDLGVLRKNYRNKISIQKTLPIIKLENSENEKIGVLPDDARDRSLYYSNNPVKNEFTEISCIYFMKWGNTIELSRPTIKDLIYNFQISLFSSFPFNSCKASSKQALNLISDLEKNARIRLCARSKEDSLEATYQLLKTDLKCH